MTLSLGKVLVDAETFHVDFDFSEYPTNQELATYLGNCGGARIISGGFESKRTSQVSTPDKRIGRIRVVLACCDQGGVNECVKHLNGKRVPVGPQGSSEDKRGDHESTDQQGPARPQAYESEQTHDHLYKDEAERKGAHDGCWQRCLCELLDHAISENAEMRQANDPMHKNIQS